MTSTPGQRIAREDDFELTHERQAALLARDGMMCEQHPGMDWPHGDCPGPGMPWMIEGREQVLALTGERDALRTTIATLTGEADELAELNETIGEVSRRRAAERDELRSVIRNTHTNYCTRDWTSRGLHAPECLLYALGEEDTFAARAPEATQ